MWIFKRRTTNAHYSDMESYYSKEKKTIWSLRYSTKGYIIKAVVLQLFHTLILSNRLK